MDEQNRQVKQDWKPALSRPDEAVEDLEPDQNDAEAVKGGLKGGDSPTEGISINF